MIYLISIIKGGEAYTFWIVSGYNENKTKPFHHKMMGNDEILLEMHEVLKYIWLLSRTAKENLKGALSFDVILTEFLSYFSKDFLKSEILTILLMEHIHS